MSTRPPRVLSGGIVYRDTGADAYESVVHRLSERAANLGHTLLNRETGEVLEGRGSWERAPA